VRANERGKVKGKEVNDLIDKLSLVFIHRWPAERVTSRKKVSAELLHQFERENLLLHCHIFGWSDVWTSPGGLWRRQEFETGAQGLDSLRVVYFALLLGSTVHLD